MKTSTSIILDTRAAKKDGTYPVKLRVTHQRKQKYYSTKFSLSKDDYEKTRGAKPRGDFKDIALELNAIERKAKDLINALPLFTWERFDKQFIANSASRHVISGAFEGYSTYLREEGRISTAVTYECANRSLEEFMPQLKFTDVSKELLMKYEKWMLAKGNSVTTVGIYLRSLRTLFNNAIAEGTLTNEYYPFGKKKYEIPTANNVKKALTLNDIAKIFNHNSQVDSTEAVCKDYWMFMYLCFGINVKDMCLLKYKNIHNGVIEFERAKTARTKRKVEAVRVPLTNELQAIIERRGNPAISENAYIFPVLQHNLTPERVRQLIQQLTQLINSHMTRIAKAAGISKQVNTYAARHSFATILLRGGKSVEFISQALGHSSIKTTQNYLAGFEDKASLEAASLLTDFGKMEVA